MTTNHFWKVAWSLMFFSLLGNANAQVGELLEGACWFEYKDTLKVASFNDKSVYSGAKTQIETQLDALLVVSLANLPHQKLNEVDLTLHCGGYGASLVAKVFTDTGSFCVWTKFDKNQLSVRSIGVLGDNEKNSDLCDGRKWGEFLMGVNSRDVITEIQSAKWSSMIKEVTAITDKVYKVVLTKDYEMRESEVINQLGENFAGKNLIRYIDYNQYKHPIGDYVPLK